jgi:hypothetical protein
MKIPRMFNSPIAIQSYLFYISGRLYLDITAGQKNEISPCADQSPGRDPVTHNCNPCNPAAGVQFNTVTHTEHDHGGCLDSTGSMTHWHYDVYNQNRQNCDCFLAAHRFGGCGAAP